MGANNGKQCGSEGKGSSSISSDMSSSTDHTPTKARGNAATSEGSASLPVCVEKWLAAEEPPSWTSEDKHAETSEEARLPPASPTSLILTAQWGTAGIESVGSQFGLDPALSGPKAHPGCALKIPPNQSFHTKAIPVRVSKVDISYSYNSIPLASSMSLNLNGTSLHDIKSGSYDRKATNAGDCSGPGSIRGDGASWRLESR